MAETVRTFHDPEFSFTIYELREKDEVLGEIRHQGKTWYAFSPRAYGHGTFRTMTEAETWILEHVAASQIRRKRIVQ